MVRNVLLADAIEILNTQFSSLYIFSLVRVNSSCWKEEFVPVCKNDMTNDLQLGVCETKGFQSLVLLFLLSFSKASSSNIPDLMLSFIFWFSLPKGITFTLQSFNLFLASSAPQVSSELSCSSFCHTCPFALSSLPLLCGWCVRGPTKPFDEDFTANTSVLSVNGTNPQIPPFWVFFFRLGFCRSMAQVCLLVS